MSVRDTYLKDYGLSEECITYTHLTTPSLKFHQYWRSSLSQILFAENLPYCAAILVILILLALLLSGTNLVFLQ